MQINNKKMKIKFIILIIIKKKRRIYLCKKKIKLDEIKEKKIRVVE